MQPSRGRLVRHLCAFLAGCALAWGQELEISISPSPVGSGARAAGMADAFVAVADDATAASWNPAGLVQLERPEVSIVGQYNGLIEKFHADYHDEVDSWHSDNNVELNFLSITLPLPPAWFFGRNSSVGLYYQRKYDFSRKFNLAFNTSSVPALNSTVLNDFLKMDFTQQGGLSTITPAFAFEVTKRFSLGVALNLWRSTIFGDNSWTQNTQSQSFTQFGSMFTLTDTVTKDEYKDFTGYNVTLGVLWNINDKWSAGARYDSAFTGKANFESRSSTTQNNLAVALTGGQPLYVIPQVRKESRQVRFPETIAFGIAYRANDRLTLSGDITTSDWNDFWFRDRAGRHFSLVNAADKDAVWFKPHFDRPYTVRLGAEYVMLPRHLEEKLDHLWTFRGGVFYDPEPASKSPDNFYGASLGVGLQLKGFINFDVAYQFRFGENVNADFIRGSRGFSEDVFENRVLVSTVIYF